MTVFETVIYERDGAVATITLNRPDALNGFNISLRADLVKALEVARSDDQVRSIVLTGAGRLFSAGADLKAGMPPDGQTVQQQLQDEYRPIFRSLRDIEKPVIAAINGGVAGIAVGLVLYCDLAVMADNAYLLPPFTTIALVADGGINWQLVRHMGYKRAFEFCAECKKIDAEFAVELGLINRIVSADTVLSEAQAWAEKFTKLPKDSLAATKRVLRHAAQNTWESSFDLEAELQLGLLGADDNLEGISAFLEKRKPEFK